MKRPVTVALADDVRAALNRVAELEDRSRSSLANSLLRAGLTARLQQTEPSFADQLARALGTRQERNSPCD